MRISSLTPQFVHETPEDPSTDAAKVISMASARRTRVEAAASDSATHDAVDEETRAGLKRLSQLIRVKSGEKREDQPEDPPEDETAREHPQEKPSTAVAPQTPAIPQTHVIYFMSKAKALSTYQSMLTGRQREESFGQFLNLAV